MFFWSISAGSPVTGAWVARVVQQLVVVCMVVAVGISCSQLPSSPGSPLNERVKDLRVNFDPVSLKATLSWQPVAGAYGYVVLRGVQGQTPRAVNSQFITEPSYVDDLVSLEDSTVVFTAAAVDPNYELGPLCDSAISIKVRGIVARRTILRPVTESPVADHRGGFYVRQDGDLIRFDTTGTVSFRVDFRTEGLAPTILAVDSQGCAFLSLKNLAGTSRGVTKVGVDGSRPWTINTIPQGTIVVGGGATFRFVRSRDSTVTILRYHSMDGIFVDSTKFVLRIPTPQAVSFSVHTISFVPGVNDRVVVGMTWTVPTTFAQFGSYAMMCLFDTSGTLLKSVPGEGIATPWAMTIRRPTLCTGYEWYNYELERITSPEEHVLAIDSSAAPGSFVGYVGDGMAVFAGTSALALYDSSWKLLGRTRLVSVFADESFVNPIGLVDSSMAVLYVDR